MVQRSGVPSRVPITSLIGRRGAGGSGSAPTGAQPRRSIICGWSEPPNTSERIASRVSATSSGSVTGQLARPSEVLVNSAMLVASPARKRARSSSLLVPRARSTAWSLAATALSGWASRTRKYPPWQRSRRVGFGGIPCGHPSGCRVASAPHRQLSEILVLVDVAPYCLCHHGFDIDRHLDVSQLNAHTRCPHTDRRDVSTRHRPGAEQPTIGAVPFGSRATPPRFPTLAP